MLLMTKDPMANQFDLSSVRRVLAGAAPISGQLINDLQEKLPNAAVGQGKIHVGNSENSSSLKYIGYSIVLSLIMIMIFVSLHNSLPWEILSLETPVVKKFFLKDHNFLVQRPLFQYSENCHLSRETTFLLAEGPFFIKFSAVIFNLNIVK